VHDVVAKKNIKKNVATCKLKKRRHRSVVFAAPLAFLRLPSAFVEKSFYSENRSLSINRQTSFFYQSFPNVFCNRIY